MRPTEFTWMACARIIEAIRAVDLAILATPTGEERNMLTEANIKLHEVLARMEGRNQ